MRVLADLHCHTAASFDSRSRPEAVVDAAVRRGLGVLAITDHDGLDGAFKGRDAAAARAVATGEDQEPGASLEVIVGEEIRSTEGDLIGLFLAQAIPSGMAAEATIEAIHDQGGLVGLPHPFDRHRGTALALILGQKRLAELAPSLDYVETFNARVSDARDNARSGQLARRYDLPGVSVSDAHTLLEIGMAATPIGQRIGTAEDLRRLLRDLRVSRPARMMRAHARERGATA